MFRLQRCVRDEKGDAVANSDKAEVKISSVDMTCNDKHQIESQIRFISDRCGVVQDRTGSEELCTAINRHKNTIQHFLFTCVGF